MQSVLEEFALGNISPEPRFFKRGSHYEKAMQVVVETEKKIASLLKDSDKEILKTFTDAQAEISLLSDIDRFIYGYRLGVLMTMEVFDGKSDLIAGGEVE